MKKYPNIKPINLKRPLMPTKPPRKRNDIIVIGAGLNAISSEVLITDRIKSMIKKLDEVL